MLNRFKNTEHLIRLMLLVTATAIIFVIIRSALMPKSFGKFGFYRAEALAEIKATPLQYAGQKSCTPCHKTNAEQKLISRHRLLSCEVCHGPLMLHTLNPTEVKASKPDSIGVCSRCHSRNVTRPKDLPQVDIEEHRQGFVCIECHWPHHPELRTNQAVFQTRYAGQGDCGDCHKAIIELKLTSKHQFLNCAGCHGHLYQHIQHPLEAKPKKPDSKKLCWRCHSTNVSRPPEFPELNLEKHSQGKSCLECHSPHHPEVRVEPVAKPVKYQGTVLCIQCHQKVEEQKKKTKHRLLSCDLCHGPAGEHAVNPTVSKMVKISTREFCSRCHTKQGWRPKLFPQIEPKQHNPGIECVECHSPHEPDI
jgi:predicted CXXCH cytochrome family protein